MKLHSSFSSGRGEFPVVVRTYIPILGLFYICMILYLSNIRARDRARELRRLGMNREHDKAQATRVNSIQYHYFTRPTLT